MTFGEILKQLREQNGLSQRELGEKSGISNTEISRIESGNRQKPSPLVLKAIYPFLGVTYEALLIKAGYMEETVDHDGYTERIFWDESGNIVDIIKRTKELFAHDSEWGNLACRVSESNLSDAELRVIKAQTRALLEEFLKNKKS